MAPLCQQQHLGMPTQSLPMSTLLIKPFDQTQIKSRPSFEIDKWKKLLCQKYVLLEVLKIIFKIDKINHYSKSVE